MVERLATGNRTMEGALRFFICLFVGLYVSGTSGYEILHKVIHSQERVVSHSAAAEKDPCHRTLHHKGEENGCTHSSHILLNDKCSLCDIIAPKDVISLHEFLSDPGFIPDTGQSEVSAGVVKGDLSIQSSRAPPFI